MLDRAKVKELKSAPAKPPTVITETLPFWGEVSVQKVSAGERDRYESEVFSPKADPEFTRARWIAACVVGPDARRVFAVDDLAWLKGLEWETIQPLFLLCQRANGEAKADQEQGAV